MFKLLAVLLSLFPLTQTGNFRINNGSVVWEKSVKSSLTINQLHTKLKQSGLLDDLEVDSVITGRLFAIEPKNKAAGYSTGLTPMYLIRSFINGFVLIEPAQDGYKLTIKNVIIETSYKEKVSLESVLLNNKGTFKRNLKADTTILNYTFDHLLVDPY